MSGNKVYRVTGGKESKVLKLENESIPKPGYGEVLLKMHAFSLNFRDSMIVAGTYPFNTKDNLIPLSDGTIIILFNSSSLIINVQGQEKWRK